MPRMILSLLVAFSLIALTWPSVAEVRLGNNVRIGGHDASNQTFNKKNRGIYYIYEGKPKKPGCAWRKNADGSRTKICNLQRKKTK